MPDNVVLGVDLAVYIESQRSHRRQTVWEKSPKNSLR